MDYGAPHQLIEWLRDGIPLPWERTPTPMRQPTKKTKGLEEHLEELISTGAYSVENGAIMTSPFFLLPKRDGSLRGIHDLREPNKYLPKPRFSLKGIQETIRVVRECRWGATLDLRRGYYQVLIKKEDRQYLGMEYGGRTLVANVLPFGLSIAPHVFQTLTGFVGRLIRQLTGAYTVTYLDDFFVATKSEEELSQAIGTIVKLFEQLGLVTSPKCVLTPSQTVTFLGLDWDLRTKEVKVGIEKKNAYKEIIKNLLKKNKHSLLSIQRIMGKLNFLLNAAPVGKLHVVGLLRWIKGVGRSKSRKNPLSPRAKADLEWWLQALEGPLQSSIAKPRIAATLVTDASDEALGYRIVVGEMVIERTLQLREPRSHINLRELQAVQEAIAQNIQLLAGRRIRLWSDNVTVVSLLKRGALSKVSITTEKIAQETLEMCFNNRITLAVRYIPGHLNAVADHLSRPSLEWSTPDRILRDITKRIGPLDLDLFASPFNKKTRKFVSMEEDAFTKDWRGHRCLIVPPLAMIPEVISRLKEWAVPPPSTDPNLWSSLGLLIVPSWERTNWHLTLVDIACKSWKYPLRPAEAFSMGEIARVSWMQRQAISLSAYLIPLGSSKEQRIQELGA